MASAHMRRAPPEREHPMDTAQPAPKPAAIADDIAPEQLIARYLTGPALVRKAIAEMDAAQLHARPIPGKMSTHEVVTHIVDSERGLGGRIKRAIAGEEPPLTQGAHPEIKSDPERDLDADLKLLETAREQMADELRQLSADVWERVALRREDRVVTVRQLLMLMTRHLENHVSAIEEKRAALGL
jgi:uncharacterized damage-inducible protein DinB